MMDPELEMQVDELCNLCTVSGPSESDLFDLYTWIDSLEFSRPKRNITRDFSDGVLMAELIGHYLPKYIDIRNYSPALSKKNKENNWEHLNIKVFSKLGLKVDKHIVEDVIDSKPGAIEKILYDLRPFIARRNRTVLNYRRAVYEAPEEQVKPSSESDAMKSNHNSPQKTDNFNSSTSTASSKMKASQSQQRNAAQVTGKKSGSGNVPLEKSRSKSKKIISQTVAPGPVQSSGAAKKSSQAQNKSRDKSTASSRARSQPRHRSQSRPSPTSNNSVAKSTPKKEEKNKGIESVGQDADPELITSSITDPFVVTTEEYALSGNVDRFPNSMKQVSERPYTPLRIETFGLV